MGMYTGLRFKGIVKPEYRQGFEVIAMNGDWEKCDDIELRTFAKKDRASFIPCGILAYMPDDWDDDPAYDRSWNEETGEWVFACSLKNYTEEIEAFLDLVPIFIESVQYCEYRYEEWNTSRFYALKDGQMQVIENEKWDL